jgi:hypothetical protein
MEWADEARRVVGEVHARLPATATLAERRAALFDAYPFGPRSMWPYKAWLTACKRYLAQFDPVYNQPALPSESPLERAKRVGLALQAEQDARRKLATKES